MSVSDDTDIDRSCAKKRRHGTKASGKTTLSRMRRQGIGQQSEVYFCKHCRGFHIGHKRTHSKPQEGSP